MGALDGIRVIDFGHYIAGPLAAVMLADQGAEVIHVDPPGAPAWQRPSDAFYSRGKRRITLDLKSAPDLEIAHRLIGSTDVVIENFRPGVMQRLGLGAQEMTARNPRLVYSSMPGFAPDDPRAGMQAWEGIVNAATHNCIPRAGEEPPGWDWSRPFHMAPPLASNFAAFLGATGIVMALIARERWGFGQAVEAPLFDAMFTLIGHSGATSTIAVCTRRAASTAAAPAPSAAPTASTSSSIPPAPATSTGSRTRQPSRTGVTSSTSTG